MNNTLDVVTLADRTWPSASLQAVAFGAAFLVCAIALWLLSERRNS